MDYKQGLISRFSYTSISIAAKNDFSELAISSLANGFTCDDELVLVEGETVESELELVELYAQTYGLLASEKEVSNQYDQLLDEHHVEYEEDNFFNYMDALNQDGTLHDEQVNAYTYDGKHS